MLFRSEEAQTEEMPEAAEEETEAAEEEKEPRIIAAAWYEGEKVLTWDEYGKADAAEEELLTIAVLFEAEDVTEDMAEDDPELLKGLEGLDKAV